LAITIVKYRYLKTRARCRLNAVDVSDINVVGKILLDLLVIKSRNFIKTLLHLFQRQLSTTDTHRTGMALG